MGGDKRHVIPPMSKHGGDISPPSPPGFTPLLNRCDGIAIYVHSSFSLKRLEASSHLKCTKTVPLLEIDYISIFWGNILL